jgi:hypothetical protein
MKIRWKKMVKFLFNLKTVQSLREGGKEWECGLLQTSFTLLSLLFTVFGWLIGGIGTTVNPLD